MIRGYFNKFNRSFKNLKNVIFHVELLSPTLNRDHRSCEKVEKNMVSRKLNVLLYAFTGEAETLQSGSSGICE